MSAEDRMITLEMSLTHLSKNYDELNEVVVEQSRDISALKTKCKELEERLQTILAALNESKGGSASDEAGAPDPYDVY